ncbi:MAG: hypothetical protein ACXIVF_19215 [Rhizobiaceae bacterium]
MASERASHITSLAGSLRHNLPSSGIVVARPDHPLLFAGPDLIVGNKGLLVAAFVPKAAEVASWRALLARLTATRLALPTHTKCVLISAKAGDMPDELTEQSFDEVYERNDAAAAGSLMSPSGRVANRAEHLSKTKQQAMISYGAILHIHEIQAARRTQDGAVVEQSRPREIYRQGGLYRLGESYVGDLAEKSRASTIASLHGYARKAFAENYDIVEGVPERKRRALDIVISDSEIGRGLDPGKPVRAAAFAGWLLTNSAAADDIDEYVHASTREFDRTRERLWSLQQRRTSF